MKYSFIYVLTLSFYISNLSGLIAQDFNNTSDSILYLTSIDEAFMIDKESKTLLKISPISNSIINALDNKAFNVEFERKLTKAISISPTMFFNFQKFDNLDLTTIRYGVEIRYYHKLKSLIRDGKQANNLSSNYFGFSFSDVLKTNSVSSNQTYNLSYGIQKRFLNFGYLNYSINLSRTRWSGINLANYQLSSQMDIGIGIGKNYKVKEETKCPIFKCYTNRKSAFKINLNNFTGIDILGHDGGLSDRNWFVYINPNFIYERKIANSPLSIENDLSLNLNIGSFSSFDAKFTYNVKNQIGFKYYVFQRKDIRNGKSGNNLSGQYSFARMTTLHGKSVGYITNPDDGTQTLGNRKVGTYNIEIGYGIQREVLKNLYFDINLGLRKNVKSLDIYEDKNINFISDIKAGLMF